MASSTIRKAIGAVKDQTSISLAKVAGNVAPDLEVLVVKATTHDNEAADDKYAREILNLMSHSRGYVNACVFAVSKRLSKTSDWIVALKALMLVHKLLNEGGPVFRQEMMFASRKGMRVLNVTDFRDDAHSNSWDHSAFVRGYALYLDQKLELVAYGRKQSAGDEDKKRHDEDGYGGMDRKVRSYDDLSDSRREKNEVFMFKDIAPEKVLERLNQLLRLLDRFLASRPTGAAKNTRMVLVAVYLLVRDGFRLYADIFDALKYLLDCFLELDYGFSVEAFDAYVNAAKMIDSLNGFFDWVKDVGLVRSSEFPEVQNISDHLLGSLEGILREKANRPKITKEGREGSFSHMKDEKEEEEVSMNEMKALPPPENHKTSPIPHPQPLHKPQNQEAAEELVNLRDDGVSADQEGNKLALALFSAPGSATPNGEWVDFAADGEAKVSSAWESPAAESGKADWEMVLVESASNLSMQQAELGGGFDPLLLNGMYDQGTVKQHTNASEMSGGSASSVAMPGMSRSGAQVLALPAPDGSVQPVGQKDPFAASLLVPPPAYVQIADMERKQQLLVQEQQLWQQYASTGMQGQLALAKISGAAAHYDASMPYGMPHHYYTSY